MVRPLEHYAVGAFVANPHAILTTSGALLMLYSRLMEDFLIKDSFVGIISRHDFLKLLSSQTVSVQLWTTAPRESEHLDLCRHGPLFSSYVESPPPCYNQPRKQRTMGDSP